MRNSSKTPTPLRPGRGKTQHKPSVLRPKPERDPKYLEFMREQICSIRFCCSAQWPSEFSSRIEAAHMGVRGLRQKTSDYEAIPLCAYHHRLGPEAHHRLGKKFATHHNIDILAIQKALRAKYEQEKTK